MGLDCGLQPSGTGLGLWTRACQLVIRVKSDLPLAMSFASPEADVFICCEYLNCTFDIC